MGFYNFHMHDIDTCINYEFPRCFYLESVLFGEVLNAIPICFFSSFEA